MNMVARPIGHKLDAEPPRRAGHRITSGICLRARKPVSVRDLVRDLNRDG
jgi:hypothetical protein